MTNTIVLVTIFVVSLIFGVIKFYGNEYWHYDFEKDEKRQTKNAPWQWTFIEIWNSFVNFLFAGLIAYYFVLVRWVWLSRGFPLNINDFILFFIFASCLLGWFPFLIKNFTEGINAIFKRVLDK